jgi:predicted ATPase
MHDSATPPAAPESKTDLLTADECDDLIALLGQLANIELEITRWQLLRDIAPELRNNIILGKDVHSDLEAIVAATNRQRADGSWPIITVIENAVARDQGSGEAAGLRLLLNTAKTHIDATAEAAQTAAAAPSRPAHNLPAPTSALIGRAVEQQAIERLLQDKRLVTITGMGGIGKTRLALAIAWDLLPRCPGGAWLVQLADPAELVEVDQAVLAALELREERGRPPRETIRAALRPRPALLVLDNCEHQLHACAELAGFLRRECPDLRILATSLQRLNLIGEQRYPLEPLAAAGAIDLFVERARQALPDFVLSAEQKPLAESICQVLEGIPLAVELAAARVEELSLEEILNALQERMPLLEDGPADAPGRHRTMRASLDWSWQLLGAAEQQLLRRLSVFAGGWTQEAAAAICSDGAATAQEVRDRLGLLIRKSLVFRSKQEDEGSSGRYRMLETVRAYAAERLAEAGEEAELTARHLAHYLALAEAAHNAPRGEQAGWRARLDAEHANLGAALDRGSKSSPELAARLALALNDFWGKRWQLTEAKRWMEGVLEKGDAVSPAFRVRLLVNLGQLARLLGDTNAAAGHYTAALALAQATSDRQREADALRGLGHVARLRGEYEQAAQRFTQALALSRGESDHQGEANAQRGLGEVARQSGEHEQAAQHFTQALALFKQEGDPQGEANTLLDLGELARLHGERQQAGEYYEAARKLYQDAGNRLSEGHARWGLGEIARLHGAHEEAREHYEAALVLYREVGHRLGEANAQLDLGEVARERGEPERAEEHYEAALELYRKAGYRQGEANARWGLGEVARHRGDYQMAAERFTEALALSRGERYRRGEANAEWGLGHVARLRGEYTAAQDHFRMALERYRDLDASASLAECLLGWALLEAGGERWPRAVQLFATAEVTRAAIGAVFDPLDRAESERRLLAARGALGAQAYDDAWREGAVTSLERVVTDMLGH